VGRRHLLLLHQANLSFVTYTLANRAEIPSFGAATAMPVITVPQHGDASDSRFPDYYEVQVPVPARAQQSVRGTPEKRVAAPPYQGIATLRDF